jgi:Extensin-like protein C-terminus
MTRGVRWFLVGSVALVTLAGCGRGFLSDATREPWRREAELACLNSGTVKEGAGVVRITPIEGPGACGADFPLKVSALGESPALGYADEVIRPPGAIRGASRPVPPPRWPITQSPYGPPPVERHYLPPSQAGAPMSIEAPGTVPAGVPQYDPPPQQQGYPSQQLGAPPAYLRAPPSWQRRSAEPGVYQSQPLPPPAAHAQDGDAEELPPYPRPGAPLSAPYSPARPLPPLGPQRGPNVLAASVPVEVRPAATLACPIVSALDHWIANAVQPSAQKWFGQPVVEIKQISSYSCRGMNGNPNAHISEHAFGNALDIAAFVLADGHRITVKGGWRGTPEEQGFLRDIQGAACDQFTTVLAPGSNSFHYDHIHVDLMRRASGRRICQPGAVDGEVVAARARQNPRYASQRVEPPPTRRYDPPFDARNDPFAWRGDTRRSDPGTTGSIASRPRWVKNPEAEDNDWVEDPGPRPAIDWSSDRHTVR